MRLGLVPRPEIGLDSLGRALGGEGYGISNPSSLRIDTSAISGRPVIAV